jgi:hypothetical protein
MPERQRANGFVARLTSRSYMMAAAAMLSVAEMESNLEWLCQLAGCKLELTTMKAARRFGDVPRAVFILACFVLDFAGLCCEHVLNSSSEGALGVSIRKVQIAAWTP